MYVQNIQNRNNFNPNFGIKNTFLNMAKNATTKEDRFYWKNLHYKAKSRLAEREFNRMEHIINIENKPVSVVSLLKSFYKMVSNDMQSAYYEWKYYRSI